jgi:hypothetical protein
MFDMLQTATADQASMMRADEDVCNHSEGVGVRSLVIGLTAFLTVVDLFATQAILPLLARHYDVTPAAMGFAVNASTMGMAVAGLVVGFFSQRIDRHYANSDRDGRQIAEIDRLCANGTICPNLSSVENCRCGENGVAAQVVMSAALLQRDAAEREYREQG